VARYQASGKSGSDPRIERAFSEVHKNVPANVKATGKTGKAKEAMLAAIAYSKAKKA